MDNKKTGSFQKESRKLTSDKRSAYAEAGVDIDAGNRSVALIKDAVQATHGPKVLGGMGSFGGLYAADQIKGMVDPVLVASTDGVGTKVVLAAQSGRYQELGRDIVNHCINDIFVQGALPLFFMDYFASSHLNPEQVAEIVTGMAAACQEAGCALLGGETAEMPGVYTKDHFDVVGTMVGIVERSNILPRAGIEPGDQLVGVSSSGPHTNGYSLIRSLFEGVDLDTIYPELGVPLVDALLAPHRSYLPVFGDLISATPSLISALIHITGGGFVENIPRVLPPGCGARLYRHAWTTPPLFRLIQTRGEIAENEMYRVFNMGLGMLAVVSPEETAAVQAKIPEKSWVIGEVTAKKGVELV